MLKFDDMPNDIDSRNLGGAPHAADLRFHVSRHGDDFIVWPAHEGNRRVNVLISINALSDLTGKMFGINTTKISSALQEHRDFLEKCANEMLTYTSNEVVLDLNSLTK